MHGTPAEVYEQTLVPGIMAAFAGLTLEAAKLKRGDRVLDVASGTGIVAREAYRMLGEGAAVTGADADPAMLAVARQREPRITWVEARAEKLPFADASFEVVTCQFGLMFFADPVAALREMWRVLAPGGYLSVTAWDAVEPSPGFDALYDVVGRVAGKALVDALRVPYSLGEMDVLLDLARKAKIAGARTDWWGGQATFPSVEALVASELRSDTMGAAVDDAQLAAIVEGTRKAVRAHTRPNGVITFAAPALTLSAKK